MRIKDWAGIKNGPKWSVIQKEDARKDHDLPEDVDEGLLIMIGAEGSQRWRTGLVDLVVKNNEMFVSMNAPQIELRRQAG